jgi:hypothetical protein
VLDPEIRGARQLALDVHSTFLHISRSTTASRIPHIGLELFCAETIDLTSQLEANLQETPIEQFPETHDTAEQSAAQEADRGPGQSPFQFQPKS